MKNGRFVEVPLPSAQYSLNIENDTVARQFRPWVVEAIAPGQTKLVLSDINSKMSSGDDATYLPSVNLYVVSPAFMNLVLLPHKNWITALHQPNAITAELYDRYDFTYKLERFKDSVLYLFLIFVFEMYCAIFLKSKQNFK